MSASPSAEDIWFGSKYGKTFITINNIQIFSMIVNIKLITDVLTQLLKKCILLFTADIWYQICGKFYHNQQKSKFFPNRSKQKIETFTACTIHLALCVSSISYMKNPSLSTNLSIPKLNHGNTRTISQLLLFAKSTEFKNVAGENVYY